MLGSFKKSEIWRSAILLENKTILSAIINLNKTALRIIMVVNKKINL